MSKVEGPRTALVVEVPEADPVIGDLRSRHDPVTAKGMPAHVTILYPFRRVAAVTPDVLAEALDVIGDVRPFNASFHQVATFPKRVVYLAPDPAVPFLSLTRALVRAFPDCEPYGGEFDETVPHLTIGHTDDDEGFVALQAAAASAIAVTPITTLVEAVALYSRDDEGRWVKRTTIPMGTDASLH